MGQLGREVVPQRFQGGQGPLIPTPAPSEGDRGAPRLPASTGRHARLSGLSLETVGLAPRYVSWKSTGNCGPPPECGGTGMCRARAPSPMWPCTRPRSRPVTSLAHPARRPTTVPCPRATFTARRSVRSGRLNKPGGNGSCGCAPALPSFPALVPPRAASAALHVGATAAGTGGTASPGTPRIRRRAHPVGKTATPVLGRPEPGVVQQLRQARSPQRVVGVGEGVAEGGQQSRRPQRVETAQRAAVRHQRDQAPVRREHPHRLPQDLGQGSEDLQAHGADHDPEAARDQWQSGGIRTDQRPRSAHRGESQLLC